MRGVSIDMKDSTRKRNEYKYIYRGICGTILTVLSAISFFYVWYHFVLVNNQTGHLTGYGNLLMAATIYVFLYVVFGWGIHAFKIGVERATNIIIAQVLTLFIVDGGEIFVSMAITGQWRFFGVLFVRYFVLWIAQSIVLGLLVMPMMALYRRIFPPLDILEIHGRYQNEMSRKINYIKYKYHISEALHYEEIERDALIGRIKAHEAVLINDLPADERNDIVKICFDIDKRVYTVPKISDIILKSSEDLNLLDTPLFLNRNMGMSDGQRALKRFLDVLCSALALVVLSPILLITAVLIRREDGGPVFYRQERCTENGRVFRILKFRSMIVDAEKDGISRPAVENDDRITKVGRVIRAWRIDELPQLVNILRGDMSIVGPRPERVEHVEKYTKEIPEFRYRMKVKGGLTGYAQVYGKYNTSALDKLKLDLMYITNYSIITDIQIVFETVKILFLKESTEGFHSSGVLAEPIELREGSVGSE